MQASEPNDDVTKILIYITLNRNALWENVHSDLQPNFFYSKGPRIFAQEGENFYRKLAVLFGLIVKLSPRGNLPWGGKGPT